MRLEPDDPAYPPRLDNLPKRPVLTTSGPLDHRGASVAIVGSRTPTPEALAFARDLARTLARANVLVISGGAIGIDAAAHEAALESGVTWCVAPNGRQRPYPDDNLELFDRIAASERSRMIWPFSDDQDKTAETPKARNAVLVALARVVVVVQAHVKSGSRNAVAHARRMHRTLFIVPAAPWMKPFSGSLEELARGGCRPLCHPSQVFRSLGIAWPGSGASWTEGAILPPSSQNLDLFEPLERASPTRPWSDDETAVFSALCSKARHVDDVIARTGLPTGATITALLTLSLKDVVVEGPDGFFRRR